MSKTFSSQLGFLWAKRHLHRLDRSTDRLVLLTIAARFNRAGTTSPSTKEIIEDAGGRFSRGQILRAVNHCEKLGLLRITNRGGGSSKPLIFTAVGWTANDRPPPSPQTFVVRRPAYQEWWSFEQ
jgi:hypothetical protein